MSLKLIEKDLELVVKELSEKSSIFSISPLLPGMGYTLGSALRRTVTSFEEGFAIRRVNFEPTVAHQYDSIPGVSEDVQEIILRLKKVRFKPKKSCEEEVVRISIKGKKVFKAGDINQEGSSFEVVDPTAVLCNMSEDVNLVIELTISKGRGYIPAAEHEERIAASGQEEVGFAIDTIYTPVTNVKARVEHVLAKKRVDYEKLSLEISTDGSVDPAVVWKRGCKSLADTFLVLAERKPVELLKRSKEKASVEENRKLLNELLSTPMVDLKDFPVRVANCFRKVDYKYLKEVILLPEKDLLAVPNFGQKCLDELKVFLESKNLILGEPVKSKSSN